MSSSIPPDWLSIEGSEFEQTGQEPKGPFEDTQVRQILNWLYSRGWHRACIYDFGGHLLEILGMRMDKHVEYPVYCSVLEAYRNEVQTFRSELADGEPE